MHISSTIIRFFSVVILTWAGTGLYDLRAARSDDDIPSRLRTGFKNYKLSGPELAVQTWTTGSVLDDTKQEVDYIYELKEANTTYGYYKTYHLIHLVRISPTSKILYFAFDYDYGQIYAKFRVYLQKSEWIVQHIEFDSHPEKILPRTIFEHIGSIDYLPEGRDTKLMY